MWRILAFGDSITYGSGDSVEGIGWVGRLQRDLPGQRVYNLGIPGDTSADVVDRFAVESVSRLRRKNPEDRVVVIFGVGANDAKGIGEPDQAQISLQEYRHNMLTLIALARQKADHVLFLGLLPVDERRTVPRLRGSDEHFFLNAATARYDAIIRECCAAEHIPVVDFFSKWRATRHYERLLGDGLHPDSQGYDMMFTSIRDALASIGAPFKTQR